MNPIITMTQLSCTTCPLVPTLYLLTATSQVWPTMSFKPTPKSSNNKCVLIVLLRSLLTENYPTKVGFAAYSVLNGLPTICGGSSTNDVYLASCNSLTPDSGWQLIGALGEGKRMTGFARLDEHSLFVTGKSSSILLFS